MLKKKIIHEQRAKKNLLASLQYNPHALQFNSPFTPLLQNRVCVAPQFEHSALTPPGPEEFPFKLRNPATEVRLVAVAPQANVGLGVTSSEEQTEFFSHSFSHDFIADGDVNVGVNVGSIPAGL